MMFINVFTFLCVKGNSKEMCHEIPVHVFQKNADVSLLIQFQDYLSRKNALLPPGLFVDPNSSR